MAQLLRGALESEGIAAIVQGEHLTSLQGQIPAGPSASSRWRPWVCGRCGEHHEGHFGSCWNCGAEAAA